MMTRVHHAYEIEGDTTSTVTFELTDSLVVIEQVASNRVYISLEDMPSFLEHLNHWWAETRPDDSAKKG